MVVMCTQHVNSPRTRSFFLQGFFWYMFYIRHDLGAYFNPSEQSAPGPIAHWVNHYFGTMAGQKPWEGKLWNQPAHLEGQASPRLGNNLHYLSRLDPSSISEDSPCSVAVPPGQNESSWYHTLLTNHRVLREEATAAGKAQGLGDKQAAAKGRRVADTQYPYIDSIRTESISMLRRNGGQQDTEAHCCSLRMRMLRRTAEAHPNARKPFGGHTTHQPPRFVIF